MSKSKIDMESLAADVALIRDNHLVHLQDDVSNVKADVKGVQTDVTEIKEKMIVIETKMDIAETLLSKIWKLLLPIALTAGLVSEVLSSTVM